jgi:hypothetical protein
MKTNGNDKALESYKIFPIFAWITICGFAYFVYNITVELKGVTDRLEIRTQQLESKINIPVEDIEDFGS